MEKPHLTYSVAIRTLGTGGEKYKALLKSITTQTFPPERVVVYIAEGYAVPDFRIGREEYVVVPKGMARQRILPYDEIASDCILMLDDDVLLSPTAAEIMVRTLETEQVDCVGADTFHNQDLSFAKKIMAFLLNGVYPHRTNIAFRVLPTGAFSYQSAPQPRFYPSESCAGPAALWRKSTFQALHLEDELWLDELGFAYGDDLVEFYKLSVNGYRLGIHYGVDIAHLDGKTDSGRFKQQRNRLELRTKANFIIWWRCFWQTQHWNKTYVLARFVVKQVYLFFLFTLIGTLLWRWDFPMQFIRGMRAGWRFVHRPNFQELRPYQFRIGTK